MGMKDDEFRLAVISQNLANISTPGYKRQVAVASSFDMQLDAAGASNPGAANRAALDTAAGAFRHTGLATDVAVEGDGFFELVGESGPVYTRQGNLRVDVQGRLVGNQDLPVSGRGGPISLSNAPFTIAANGDIHQGDRIVGQLRLVHFDKPELLAAQGQGTYTAGGARMSDGGESIRLRIGFQEQSNVNSAQEMVRLTETVRHFEAMQKAVQGYDDTLGNTIRKLGEF